MYSFLPRETGKTTKKVGGGWEPRGKERAAAMRKKIKRKGRAKLDGNEERGKGSEMEKERQEREALSLGITKRVKIR